MKLTLDINEQLRAFHARNLTYRRHGHDRIGAARFVIETVGALRGPVLDVGTGKGLLAIALAQKGLEVISVDVDSEEQELARLLAKEAGVGSRISFVRADAAHLPYPNGRFNCVAMMDVLHHLDEPASVLGEMLRVLNDGGIIIVADFDQEGFELVSRIHREEGRVHLRTATTVDLARNALAGAGCRDLTRTSGCLHEIVVMIKS
jgi:ubiquinone/menaquinone biosynthesis C-methylase UbiE